MNEQLILLLLFSGVVTSYRSVHHSYHLIMNPLPWPNAQNYCRTVYTDLATIITNEDWIYLNKEATRVGYTSYSWIGLYDDVNGWRWSLLQSPLKNVPYTNWYNGQPDNYGGNEACVMIYLYGTWADAECPSPRPFICYDANFSGAARFIGINTPITWLQAQSYCQTYHTDLASSLNSSDNNLLMKIRNAQGDSWIGLYRNTWSWSDGTTASNLPWAPGQPDPNLGNANCVSQTDKVFNNYYCSNPGYFYCHTIRPAREQQIIKLKVKSDGSGLDPALQSAILEMIKLKLEEKGMLGNTTVTWKVQPDGKVFYKKYKGDL